MVMWCQNSCFSVGHCNCCNCESKSSSVRKKSIHANVNVNIWHTRRSLFSFSFATAATKLRSALIFFLPVSNIHPGKQIYWLNKVSSRERELVGSNPPPCARFSAPRVGKWQLLELRLAVSWRRSSFWGTRVPGDVPCAEEWRAQHLLLLSSQSRFPGDHLYPGKGNRWRSVLGVSLAELSPLWNAFERGALGSRGAVGSVGSVGAGAHAALTFAAFSVFAPQLKASLLLAFLALAGVCLLHTSLFERWKGSVKASVSL